MRAFSVEGERGGKFTRTGSGFLRRDWRFRKWDYAEECSLIDGRHIVFASLLI